MEQSPASGRLDWGLFLLIIVSSYGFSAFLPGEPTVTSLLLSCAILSILVIRNLDDAFTAMSSNFLFVFLAFWSLGAALLSADIGRSLLRVGVLILMMAYVCMRESTAEQTLQTVALATTISLVPSIVGLIIPLGVPTKGRAGSSAGYAGYFPYNSIAGVCAAVALLSIAVLVFNASFKWWQLPGTAGALLMLVLSKSATAIVACAAGAVVLVGLVLVRRASPRTRPLAVAAGLGIVGALLAMKAPDLTSEVAEATGRTSSFTGRTTIWQQALDGISESPILGHGGGFWDSYRANTAHNGYLDVAVSGGVPAVVALGAIIIVAGVRLAFASSPMLPLLVLGAVANIALAHLAAPSVTALAVWLSIGATVRRGMAKASDDVGVSAARKPRPPTATPPSSRSFAGP